MAGLIMHMKPELDFTELVIKMRAIAV